MAQTTTEVNACDAVIQLDDETGVLVDISGSSNTASINLTNDISETTVFGGNWKLTGCCKSAATFAVNAVYTTAANEAKDIFVDWQFTYHCAKRTLQINIPDNEIGSDRYQSEVLLESLSIPIDSGDATPILIAASMRNSGAVAHTVVAT